MGKVQNYIVILTGSVFTIAVIIFGVFQFIVYSDKPDTQQILDFFQYVLPSTLGTAFVVVRILNFRERKDLKAATDLANEYAEENKKLYKANVTQLAKVEEALATYENVQEENKTEHKAMKGDMKRIEKKIDDHILAHKV